MGTYSLFRICFLCACTLIIPLSGCGGDANRSGVQGTVTLDGAPLPEGTIQFVPAPGVSGPPVQMQIQNGKFASEAVTKPAIGTNLVQITAMKKSGKKVKSIMGEESDEVIQYLPAKYNEFTELRAEIKSGSNQLDFPLQSAGK